MRPIMMLKKVSVRFKNKVALAGFDCQLETGEIIGLVGSNGAGKTTLMKTILNFVPLSGGSIMHDQITMGALIEQPALYPFLTGREHFTLFADHKLTTAEIEHLCEDLALRDFIDRKTKDYSLGMKQRLAIALAFLNHPRLVILDEPMNGLDPQSIKRLKRMLLSYKKSGGTCLIASHLLSELEPLVDRVLLMKAGRLIEVVDQPEKLADFEASLLDKLDEERNYEKCNQTRTF